MRNTLIIILTIGLLGNLMAQTEKSMEYQPDWTSYFSNVNDKLSSIATDLNLVSIAPINDQAYVIYVSIIMQNPREDGLSSKKESEKLWEIEDKIIEKFDNSNQNYTFVGRLTSDGYRDLYFYAEDTILLESLISSSMIDFPMYKFDFGNNHDMKWEGYFDFLYPLPRQMQAIQNQRVVENLQKGGDDLTKEREVVHWIYFTNENELEQFQKFSETEGFKTLKSGSSNGNSKYEFVIQISRTDKVGYSEIDEYTLKLLEKAVELNGDYDGWETSVEK